MLQSTNVCKKSMLLVSIIIYQNQEVRTSSPYIDTTSFKFWRQMCHFISTNICRKLIMSKGQAKAPIQTKDWCILIKKKKPHRVSHICRAKAPTVLGLDVLLRLNYLDLWLMNSNELIFESRMKSNSDWAFLTCHKLKTWCMYPQLSSAQQPWNISICWSCLVMKWLTGRLLMRDDHRR